MKPKNSVGGNRRRVKDIYDRKMHWIRTYKSMKGCFVCGEKDPIVLDIHHHEDNKHATLKRRGGSGVWRLSWDALKLEMEKSSVVCANCHRRITFRG